ncbi:MAG: Smr/MutS family protein [Desulfobacterota bacterium]|nr:Smr/MutS family protein [Thermodesulfobacteriota bacterium]MDW8001415.1 Smr/MutS family protein [Deltaproteobacteria bacterium]
MPDNTLHYLDYLKILHLLKSYAQTEYAPPTILELRPTYDIAIIKERHEVVGEVLEVISRYGKLPLFGIPDIREIVKRVSIGNTFLEAKEFLLLESFLQSVHDLAVFLRKLPKRGRYLTRVLEGLDPLPELKKRIAKIINKEGYVEDNASFELLEIRKELQVKRSKIKRYMEKLIESDRFRNFLQDNYITIRNGRYVIPMKPNFNQAVEGIVHDYSHTLKTSFVEPIECVGLNNEINVLEKMEREEEERILKELTSQVNDQILIIKRNIELIKELDFFSSLASFAIDFSCVRPEVVESGDLYVKDAVNPILRSYKGDNVVPIDIIFKKDKSVLIISGPNAGGKTVALKTIGLLLLMAYSGMFVPASYKARIPLFKKIYALIGDEQDLSKDLSSFTSHVIGLRDIYQNAEGGELILVDEIGGGTDPQEASALSMAVIDAFVEKGCKIVVTTHLAHLKGYGFTKEFAENVACAYDTERMVPLYRLIYGISGTSCALDVARFVGLPEKIVQRSVEYLGKQEYILTDLIESLKKEKETLEKEKEEIAATKAALKRKLESVSERKKEILKKIEERFRSKIEELETKIKEVEEEISKKERASIKRAATLLKAIKGTLKVEREEKELLEDIKVGDLVRIKNIGSQGYVSRILDDDLYEIVIGNVRTKIDRKNLIKLDGREEVIKEGGPEIRVVNENLNEWNLNLRGMTVEDAIESLERFMDRAILNGVTRVKILHGIGTGKLMSKVREYLSTSKYVMDFKPDDKNPGVTVVNLK